MFVKTHIILSFVHDGLTWNITSSVVGIHASEMLSFLSYRNLTRNTQWDSVITQSTQENSNYLSIGESIVIS